MLALHLRGDAFSQEEKARDFAYYERLTVRDSSLSACTQAVVAAEVGYLELAYDYFGEAALIDLDNLEHNTRDGLHMASLAGAWIVAVAGFGGMRDHDGSLTFAPPSPAITRLAFGLCFRGRQLKIEVALHQARYSLLEGAPLEITHHGETLTVAAAAPVTRTIPPPPAHEVPQTAARTVAVPTVTRGWVGASWAEEWCSCRLAELQSFVPAIERWCLARHRAARDQRSRRSPDPTSPRNGCTNCTGGGQPCPACHCHWP